MLKYKKNLVPLPSKKESNNNVSLTIHGFILITICTFIELPAAHSDDHHCIVDRSFTYTENINKYLYQNPISRKILVIISSFLIDFSVLSLMYVWLIYGRCWRSIIIISLFYGLRGLCNSFFLLQTPNNLIWDFPGLWSFSVSYHQTTDFFFSGHVGINLISSIELDRLGFKKISFISFMGVFIQILVMISVRGHFIIDLIAGLLAAHYCIFITEYIHIYINLYVMNLNEYYITEKNE